MNVVSEALEEDNDEGHDYQEEYQDDTSSETKKGRNSDSSVLVKFVLKLSRVGKHITALNVHFLGYRASFSLCPLLIFLLLVPPLLIVPPDSECPVLPWTVDQAPRWNRSKTAWTPWTAQTQTRAPSCR